MSEPAQKSITENIGEWLDAANGILWGPPLLILLVGTHIYLTFRLGIIQRWLGKGIRLSTARKRLGDGDISQFGALTVAMAATLGTGNIVGVATAIGMGGPGAVFWMWITGVFGIATKYAEAFLAVKYRQVNARGEMIGGPMEVIEYGLGQKWLAVIFAAFAAVAAFGIGNMNQANSIADQIENIAPAISPHVTGLVLAGAVALVILGGVRIIANVCQLFIPFMVVLYMGGCLVILALELPAIPGAVGTILSHAFSLESVGGGLLGTVIAQAIRYGIARGLFSNESGMGSGGFFAAAARTRNPAQQALVSMTGTFWDTVVVCLVTGLVIVSTGVWETGLTGASLTSAAFASIPHIGPFILTAGLLTFVFSTLIGWSYIGEKSIEYLFGVRLVLPYRILWVIVIYIGATSQLSLVWAFSDMTNALMAIPNLIALLLLSGMVARESRKYLQDPATFDVSAPPDSSQPPPSTAKSGNH